MRNPIRRVLMLMMFAVFSTVTLADAPDCTGREDWPAGMAYAALKNAGILDASTVDFYKTKVTRLASEKIGADLYRQVHRVRFVRTSGKPVVVITVNNVSDTECSRSGVEVYVVSKRLGNYAKGP
jgi:hypothetical protein